MRQERSFVADVVGELERGRESYMPRAWADAYQALTRRGEFSPLQLAALAQYNGDERCNRDSGRDNDLAGRRWSIPHRAPADHASSRAVSPGE